MTINDFVNFLLVIKHKEFVKIIKIKDKKNNRLLTYRKMIRKTFFIKIKLISIKYLDLELICFDI